VFLFSQDAIKLLAEDDCVGEALKEDTVHETSDFSDDSSDSCDEPMSSKKKRKQKEVLYRDSPFYNDFLVERIEEDNSEGIEKLEPNKWFIPGFINYLMKKFMPFYPLISCYLVTEKGWIFENPPTNAVVEQSFRILKNIDFPGLVNIPADLFLPRNISNILQSIKFLETDIPIKKYQPRAKATEKSHEDKALENWRKARKRGLPAYSALASKLRYGKMVRRECQTTKIRPSYFYA
jgi:hypothetical protein